MNSLRCKYYIDDEDEDHVDLNQVVQKDEDHLEVIQTVQELNIPYSKLKFDELDELKEENAVRGSSQ